ncbi:hypothetical protein JDV02_006467 [Purpureocillium takamizusanense]|uniref:tRNA nucleotidyltransferase n=1 Tax=Purpureocillium takamizusanense TaxID=2060973 RepID=A0A9Q8VC55_9HYPO|nr:uncharacterized protein JDV02_006467 [Purpureocillium takamizusanense]UNI20373.1 hypothetical protein JDV02_006467 [Purpureocillium takamizusanense]
MNESLRSRGSLERLDLPDDMDLNDLADGRGPELWLDHAVAKLRSALDEKSRHDEMLRLHARLSNMPLSGRSGTINTEELCHVITTALLPLDQTTDLASRGPAAELALACLALLSPALDDSTLLTVIAYTEDSAPWTTEGGARLAAELIQSQLDPMRLDNFISGPLLQGYIRPMISSTTCSRLTGSGRPVQFHQNTGVSRNALPDAPWKRCEPPVMTIFGWAVEKANNTLVDEKWPLFLPALLAFTTDYDAMVREKGLRFVSIFLHKLSARILKKSGVGDLLQDAIFPTLLSLPSVTPERQSAMLLRAAYPVFLQLAEADPDPNHRFKKNVLDKVLRDGILQGYYHAVEYATIVEILLHSAASVVSCLGLSSVRHLQGLLDMAESTMTDPFAVAYPPAIEAAINLLCSIMWHCWPRMSGQAHGPRVIRAAAVCWLNLQDQEQHENELMSAGDRQLLQDRLRNLARLLMAAWGEQKPGMGQKISEAMKKEPRLTALFAEDASGMQHGDGRREQAATLPG